MTNTHTAWKMPSETDPHDRVFMAFPPLAETFGFSPTEAAEARDAWAAVANATVDFVPVTMLVDPADRSVAQRLVSEKVTLVDAPLDDAWMRDIGPTFVTDDTGRLGAIDWVFNGWGQQDWAKWENDNRIARVVAELAGAEVVDSELVNEGGGIHVDGRGTVLLTETVQLDRFRNPDWSRNEIEAELRRVIGADRALWFPRGLHRDSQRFGTRGHIDIVATPTDAETLMVHRQADPTHPDFHLSEVYDRVIEESTNSDGQPWKVLDIFAPTQLRDEEGWLDYSYVNHLVTNGAVIACMFDDANDAAAAEVLAEAYPGREVVGLDARNIFAYGGGIHCITQHQPRVG